MRQARGHLAEVCQILLELHSLTKLNHFGDIGHQTKRAFDVLRRVTDWRDAQSNTALKPARKDDLYFFAPERSGEVETLGYHRGHVW